MNTQKRKLWATAQFVRCFGDTPEFWTRAPGRVDLMGSHTDYNDGFILTMTIDRDTWLAARRRNDGMVRVTALDLDESGEFSLAQIAFDRQKRWINYVSGVAKVLQEAGIGLCGFDGLIHSTVPLASGLSSSAALELAVARMFEQVSGFEVDRVTLARLAQKAENEFVGVNCGILDQYTSSAGRAGCALLLDARSLESSNIPIAPGFQVVICDTRAPRTLSGTEYSTRRAQCEEGVRLIRSTDPAVAALRDVSAGRFAAYEPLLPQTTARRCRFIIEENARVLDLAQVLPTGDTARLAELWAASYAGARDLYESCVPAMDAMLAAMRSAPGFVAGRQAGAGFGGCMVAFTSAAQTHDFIDHVHHSYLQATGIPPNVFAVAATDGASVLA